MGSTVERLTSAQDHGAEPAGRVAILLATKNGANHLEEQLSSYLAQTLENWCLHVSDDGSSDETIEIIKRFAATHGRVQTIHEGPHRGHAQNFLSLAQNSSI